MKRRLLGTAGAVLATGSLVLGSLALGACSKSSDVSKDTKHERSNSEWDETVAKVAGHYAQGVHASYAASVDSAKKLDEALKTLTESPTEETLAAAKDAWVAGRVDYRPTEAFRFYDGPIDEPDEGPEGRINAWPMDEAYVDYVEGPDGIQWVGIINDNENYPEINKDVLVEANERDGEQNISTGWHAIEFLLWGQDMNDDGPGDRPVSDYTTAQNADRRAQYLELLGEVLVSDLESVADQWKPDEDNYRAEFLAEPDKAIAKIFRGIGALTVGELSGERIAVAVETQDQEDEHSCFSDTTNDDVAGNILGIQDVLSGSYPNGVPGQGLQILIVGADIDTGTELKKQVAANLAMAQSFPQPFDQMLANDTAPLEELIDGLTIQGKLIAQAAKKLDIEVDTGV